MPVAVSFDKDQRIYVQAESTFGIIPNTGGVATLSGANAMRHIDVTMKATESMIVREDKTGDRTKTPGKVGRFGATWGINASFVTNGTPGTVSDADPVLASGFCNAATVKAGTATVTSCVPGPPYVVTTSAPHNFSSYDCVWVPASAAGAPFGAFIITVGSSTTFTLLGCVATVAITAATSISRSNIVYTLADLPTKSFDLWSFRTPATLRQEVCLGSVVSSMKWTAGEDAAAKVAYTGVAKWLLDNKSLADSVTDTDQQGGLTAFPSEPASPVTNGSIIPAFLGYLVLNGNLLVKLRSWGITHNTGIGLPQEYIGTRYGQTPEAGDRETLIDLLVDDDDSAALQAYYEAAQTATPVDGIFVQGNQVQGNTQVWLCRGIQLPMPDTQSTGRKFTRNFSGAVAHGSGIATLDEIKLIQC